MKKNTFPRAVLVLALALTAMGASAQSYNLTNAGRIHNVTNVYSAANGNGGSMSHAEGSALAVANGAVAVAPGAVAISGEVSGFNNAMAFNTSYGSGVGSASSVGYSDASVYGHASASIPTGTIHVDGSVDGGMLNPQRNGSDVSVTATTSQDGFANGSYSGAFAVNGAITMTPIAGGAAVAGYVADTKTSESQAVAGGVTFTGGTPEGQTAAVRFANGGVTVEATGVFQDPVH